MDDRRDYHVHGRKRLWGGGAMPTPTPTFANVAGIWRGTVSFTAGGIAAEEIYEMTLVQPSGSASVTGSYTATRFSGNSWPDHRDLV